MRSYAREVAFCKIYAFVMTSTYDGDFSQFDADKLTEEDLAFADRLASGVAENKAHIDSIVAKFSHAFKTERIYRPDLATLEMAIFEMENCDTPHPVVINEAVGIAKKYSTEKSASFVNGILAAYEKSLSEA